MTETKAFPTAIAISAVSGVLICDMGDVHATLDWMTGESLFTHQLPRACDAAKTAARAFDPRFETVLRQAKEVTEENWAAWRDVWLEKLGPTITLPKIADWAHIDPIRELQSLTSREDH